MGLRGMRKLRTGRPWCRGHAYFISSAIVRAHKLKVSSTDISQCPRKQRGLCYQTQGFKGIIIRGEPQLIYFFFFLETRVLPVPSLLLMLLKILLLIPPSQGLGDSLSLGTLLITAFAISNTQPSQNIETFSGYLPF